jgi:hypothetical protein
VNAPAPFDPLRLCIYAPYAVAGFAGLGLAGYLRARRAGLSRSRCLLRDTRLVIAYLALLLAVALVTIGWQWSHR